MSIGKMRRQDFAYLGGPSDRRIAGSIEPTIESGVRWDDDDTGDNGDGLTV